MRQTFSLAYFHLSPLKHVKKVVGGFGKKIVLVLVCQSQETDRHELTVAVNVALNPNTNILISILKRQSDVNLHLGLAYKWHDVQWLSPIYSFENSNVSNSPYDFTIQITLSEKKPTLLHEPCKSPSKVLLIVFLDESLW